MKNLLYFAVFMALANRATAQQSGAPTVIPSQALIQGVPFVSWGEAARLDYENKDILNPSSPAANAMLLKYWASDATQLKLGTMEFPENWIFQQREAKGIDELKPLLAQGVPILVYPALTPVAHPIQSSIVMFAELKGYTIKDKGPLSPTMGEMVSLNAARDIETMLGVSVIKESLFVAPRVLIGYDDQSKVVILHDPSLGPAWGVSYDDFDKMWTAGKKRYIIAHPPDYVETLTKRRSPTPATPPYAARTANQRGVGHLLWGASLASVGRVNEAQEELKKGLAIPEISQGYQSLFLLELATLHDYKGEPNEALILAQKATEIVPEDAVLWQFIAQTYRKTRVTGWKEKAFQAEKKVKIIASDRKAHRKVAEILPGDFWIRRLAGIRGWAMNLTGDFSRTIRYCAGSPSPSSMSVLGL